MKVVVDSNILIAALLSPGSPKWKLLRELDQPVAPGFLRLEIREHWERIERSTGFSPTELLQAKHELFDSIITFVEIEEISDVARQRAFDLCREVDLKDVAFVALTVHTQGVLWTGDEALKRGLRRKFFHMFLEPDFSTHHLQAYLEASDSITGQPLIRTVRVHGDRVGIIQFWADYEEHKAHKPHSGVTPEVFDSYFGTGDQISKILVREPVRVLRNLPSLKAVQISVPFKDVIHTTELSRSQAEEYFGIDLLELGHSPEKWREFVDSQVYSKENRQIFLERFARREKWSY